jgi:hypothetical protein
VDGLRLGQQLNRFCVRIRIPDANTAAHAGRFVEDARLPFSYTEQAPERVDEC